VRQIERTPGGQAVNAMLWALAITIFGYVLYSSQSWPFVAKLMPQVVAAIGLIVVAAAIAKELIGRRVIAAPAVAAPAAGAANRPRDYRAKEPDPLDALATNELLKRAAAQAAWLIGFALLIYLIGILPATLIFVPAYMIIEGGMAFPRAALISAIYVGAMFLLFDRLLHMPWPTALIGDIWPGLRDVMGLRLV
jgi:hypothetical protein